MLDNTNKAINFTDFGDSNKKYSLEELVEIYKKVIEYIKGKTRGFEYVKTEMMKHKEDPDFPKLKLPRRSDDRSAGYDFYSPGDYVCEPHKVTKIWTDVKAYMLPDEFLFIDVRSSMGGKFHLANTIGIVDSSYYSNESNDGNIGIFLVNDTDEPITIKTGDRIAQGIFMKYLTVDGDLPISTNRTGGFGSTGVN